jgi:aryl-alcohol dehydrogenase-like predicted oxidoreductase
LRKDVVIATKPARLDEDLGAASLQLAADDMHEIEDAAAAIKVQGARYPEELMKMTGL